MNPEHLDLTLAAFGRLGVNTVPRIQVMLHLYAHGPCTATQVCKATDISTGFLTVVRHAFPHLLKEAPRPEETGIHGAYSLDLSDHMRREMEKILRTR